MKQFNSKQLVQTSSSSDLGITIIVIYSIIFSYTYMNYYYKKRKSFGFAILDYKKGFMISDSFYNTEKFGTSIALLMFSFVTSYMLYKQNFTKYTIGNINIGIIFCFWLIFTGFMYVNSKLLYTHSFMGLMIFIGGQIFALIALFLYSGNFKGDDITELTTLTYILTVMFFINISLIGVNGYIKYRSRNKFAKRPKISKRNLGLRLINDIMGLSGITYVVLFGMLLYTISIYPALPIT